MVVINKRLLCTFLIMCIFCLGATVSAQEIIDTRDNYGTGITEYIWNAFTGAGDVTNSSEFVPFGFNINDPSVKHPIIFYFPGAGDVKTGDKNSVLRLSLRGPLFELEGGNFPRGTFNFIVVGMQGSVGSSANEFAAFMENYIFVKFRNKIDFSRVYLTGLSVGGGRIIDYMANASRASKIAAIAPIALRTDCPYISGCGAGSAFFDIVNNIQYNPQLGVFLTHNLNDPLVPYTISKGYVDAVNTVQPGRVQFFFDPVNDLHDAWSKTYPEKNKTFGNKNMYDWFLQYSLNNTLPVKLSSFTAETQPNNQNLIKWVTEEESNSSFFAIEKSINGKDFAEIGRVPAAGNSSTPRNYSFTDAQPVKGANYYRLKQVDKNNAFEYSAVKKLVLSNKGLDFQLGPNPFSNQLNLTITGDTKLPLTASIVDVNGRLISQTQLVKTTLQFKKNIDLSSIASGVYILRVTGENVLFTQKLIKN